MKESRFVGLSRIGILLVFFLMLGISTAFSSTITVTNTNDAGAGSLRQALADANSGDTIEFSTDAFPDADTGAITLTSGQLTIDKALTVDGDGRVTLDGNTSARVLNISYSTETHFVNVTLKGLKIVNGAGDYGAGVQCFEILTATDCIFSGNNASMHGGGLIVYYGTGTLSRCQFTNNQAGINQYGGGMALYNDSDYTVDQCTFTGNSANGGGGIYVSDSNLTLTNSLLQGNQSGGGGGGVRSYNSTIWIINSTLSGNANQYNGFASAMRNHLSDVYIVNSTITGGGTGIGAISNLSASCTITSTIIAENEGVDIHWIAGDIQTYPVTVSRSLVESVDTYTLTNGVDGNIVGQSPGLDALADNGGPTLTHALLSGSPAIDTGANTLSLQFDQRGQGFARNLGEGPDMGAYEAWNVVIVHADGRGSGTILSSPAGIDCDYPITSTASAIFPSGVVTLTATAKTGSLAYWCDCESLGGTLETNGTAEAACAFNPIGAQKVITATFALLDTDNDGILDIDEDKDQDGEVDPDETDPTLADTDQDGIQDGTELGLTLDDVGLSTDQQVFQPDLDPETTTNPLVQDSDEDGVLDGLEDANHNGRMDLGETSAARKSGDLNGDGSLTLEDAIRAVQDMAGMVHPGDRLADMDGDGHITLKEALFVLRTIQE
ncbi:MAG: hypothetical protein JEZ02_11855 [Desulfatibacillum sp.]|nr:hypothetical protein [Desulfatibacillum sp.]